MEENLLSAVERVIERQTQARDKLLTIEKTVLYQYQNCNGDMYQREKRLKESVGFVEDILNNSSSQDGHILSMVLNRLLINGLALQYREIRKELDEVKSICNDGKLEGLSEERLESLFAYVGRRIESICDKIVNKASTEETILKTARQALLTGTD